MKKVVFILIALVVFNLNAQKNTDLEFKIPKVFFEKMFRDPTNKYLVAWSGGVSTIVKNQFDQEIQVEGIIQTVEDYLNTELTKLDRRQFEYNLNTPTKRITTPNNKTWAGHCGYNPYEGITYNDIMNGVMVNWPSEITNDIWALHVSKKHTTKGTYKNPKSEKIEMISVYFQATSIFYYHSIKPQSFKGKVIRDDGYRACGTLRMHRLGPGKEIGQNKFNKETKVKADNFEFVDELYLGDYQVQYLWEDGTYQELEYHVVYDPFGVLTDEFHYELKAFKGKISGALVDEETHKPIKNQKVILKPFCEESTLPEKEIQSDEEGGFEFIDVPKGVYYVVTKGAPDTMAGLVKDPLLRLREIEVRQNTKYDIYVTYTASGFVKAKLVWRSATIKFPNEGEEIQFFDMMAFKNSGNYDTPTGTDGKPLAIPYTTVIPGIGKQTIYGWPESETATPEVIYTTSLGGYKVYDKFRVDLDEQALNTCNISQIGNGPIFLDLNFDLTGRYSNSSVWQQEDVGCMDKLVDEITRSTGGVAYPVAFKQVEFTDAEIEKFNNSEAFERILSNGKATLKIEFKPLDNE